MNHSASIEQSSPKTKNRLALQRDTEDGDVDRTSSVSFLTLPPLRVILTEEHRLSHEKGMSEDRNETVTGRVGEHRQEEIRPSPSRPPDYFLKQEGSQHQQANNGKRRYRQINPTSLPTIQPKALRAQPNQKVAIRTQVAALVSKSNYEHMAQTSAPEVELFYPDGLMADFTAKRQHRKLSEKARRDRMKTALKGLSDVISHRACPEAAGGALHQDINGNSQSKEVAGRFPSEHSDRVSVVEAATLYIHQLQKKLAETNHRLDEASHSGMANLEKKTNM